jgi:tRNA(fMet)-specific endonuclease VapC
MRRPASLARRFVQHTGQLAISSVTLAELFAGAYQHSQANRLLALIRDLRQEIQVIDFDATCAEEFGRLRGTLRRQGLAVPTTDLMIATAALVHDLTLVTHNIADFQNIPGLRLADWLVS